MKYAIGLEIGGTKLQAGIGLKEDRLLARARTQVDPKQGAEGIRRTLPQLIEEALTESGVTRDQLCGIGVGFGGPVQSEEGVTLTSHQIEGWDQFPLRQWLSDQWKLPVHLQNDASIAGYAEAQLGAGKGCSRVFYMTIGSGIGGGWILDGTIDEGQGWGAGEIGHTWVPDPDTGEVDKLENICSGWSMAERAREAIRFGEESIITAKVKTVEEITAEIVYRAAEYEDLLASAILEETCLSLAVAICNVIALLHPHKVIIGGGVSLMGPLFWDTLQEMVQAHIFQPFNRNIEVVPAKLGEDVVLMGAVLLAQTSET